MECNAGQNVLIIHSGSNPDAQNPDDCWKEHSSRSLRASVGSHKSQSGPEG